MTTENEMKVLADKARELREAIIEFNDKHPAFGGSVYDPLCAATQSAIKVVSCLNQAINAYKV